MAYIKKQELTDDEKAEAKRILDGSVYTERKKDFDHCQLCSNKFVADIFSNTSKKYRFWEICCPTHPYTPGGLMIYLKSRNEQKLENIQDLSKDEFDEIIEIMKDIYYKLLNKMDYEVVGINILFNQISKSQLCIHGHLEIMIANVDSLDFGCSLKEDRPYDILTSLLNCKIPSAEGIHKVREGIRLDMDSISSMEALKIVKTYEEVMKLLIDHGRRLQKKVIGPKSNLDIILAQKLSPSPVNYIYLTYYRDKVFLSCVPEMTLEPVINLDEIKSEESVYSLKINQYTNNDENKIMRQFSPMVRPSIKISRDDHIVSNVDNLKKSIKKILEER